MPIYKDKPISLKPIPLYTMGKSVPKGGRRGCLCADKSTYDKKCCKEYLINQGIGVIQGVPIVKRKAFSKAFSNGFS